MEKSLPKLVVFSSLFPSSSQPNAGIFIRERMFRVGKQLPVVVVSPRPWFPFQNIVRRWRPHFRPAVSRHEQQMGVDVYFPRFLSFPGILKSLDGLFMALACIPVLRRLKQEYKFNLLDAHFGYPDGYAATLLGRWFRVPVTITMRGTEIPQSRKVMLRRLLKRALQRANHVFSVSASLGQHAQNMGVDGGKIQVVGNGVDVTRFYPVPAQALRKKLGLPDDAKVMITVGGLVERKGFHRVIEVMPSLMRAIPELHYLVVGGPSAEGDWSERLREQVKDMGLTERVHFLGTYPPEQLKSVLSAADIFVLSTRNEGWANVILEAMACGLPVIATDVGGNREVVCSENIGKIVPFGDRKLLEEALAEALGREWDHNMIIQYARENSWDSRVEMLVERFGKLCTSSGDKGVS